MQDIKETEGVKIRCRNCRYLTRHKVLHTVKFEDTEIINADSDFEVWYVFEYEMLQCQGCETVCLRETYWDTDGPDTNTTTGEPIPAIKIYPDPLRDKDGLDWSERIYLPKTIQKIYKECLVAYNTKLPILTSIGLRAIIEGVCTSHGIVNGNLNNKIDALEKKDLITKGNAKLLHLNRYMGNASAHELAEPLADELDTGIDIVETLLKNAYILPEKAKRLTTGIPKPTKEPQTLTIPLTTVKK